MDKITEDHIQLVQNIINENLENNNFDNVHKLIDIMEVIKNNNKTKNENINRDLKNVINDFNDGDYYLSHLWDAENVYDDIEIELINKKGCSLNKCRALFILELDEFYKSIDALNCAPYTLKEIRVLRDGDDTKYDSKYCNIEIKSVKSNKINFKYVFSETEGKRNKNGKHNKIKFTNDNVYELVEVLGYGTSGGLTTSFNAIIVKKTV